MMDTLSICVDRGFLGIIGEHITPFGNSLCRRCGYRSGSTCDSIFRPNPTSEAVKQSKVPCASGVGSGFVTMLHPPTTHQIGSL